MQFINTGIKAGIWRGDLTGAGAAEPALQVTHLGTMIEGVSCAHHADSDLWRVRVPIPHDLISDGVQTFVISDAAGATLGSFTVICGEPLTDDLRAEIGLLRSELDLLKKAFRRHCSET